jgi:hypothetical protein
VLKIRLWLVLGLLGLSSLLGLFSTFAWITADPPVVDFSSARPFAEGQAVSIATSWASGKATSLPVAEGVDPRFNSELSGGLQLTIQSVAPVGWFRDTVNGRLVETQYVLIDAIEGDYVAYLSFVFQGPVPVLASYPAIQPSISPVATQALEYQEVPTRLEQAPAAVRERIEQWGKAYAANDGASLRDLADDTGATAEMYRGLGGLTLVTSPDLRAVVQTPSGLVIRARFSFARAAGSAGFVMDMDLLITAQDSTKPRIVAWGPSGTGPALRPYQNRVL